MIALSDLPTNGKITRETIIRTLLIAARRRAADRLAARVAACVDFPPNPPYIEPGSQHFLFALLVTQGTPYTDACEMIGAKTRTADGWRRKLCQAGKEYFGREVNYEFLADYCTNQETRAIYERIDKELASEAVREGQPTDRKPSPKQISH
ncbi:MAG: hypothetical protein EOP06_22085 [Proteobacteria bacterium]|nr:MAG: hypothetical protein EOP06_22085 [Pseudomonadota bacterium]